MPPESEFGPALARLFRQAGKPTLRVASEALARSRRADAPTPQRISDWRNGRHIPRDFNDVLPLILWLNQRAVDAGATGLVSVRDWERLWRLHHESRGKAELDDPFPGLASMRASDRDRYFGRDATIAELTDVLFRARESAENRVVIVTGVSGAGKSSLLGAGLARAQTPWNAPVALRVGSDVLIGDEAPAGSPLVVVDQFEEVFGLAETDQQAIFDAVAAHSDAGSVVVLGIRADFFGQTVEVPMLAKAWQDRSIIVSEMSDDELRRVITEPVRLAAGKIDDGLVDLILDDLHRATSVGDRAGRLPLLAHALQVMWSQRKGNRLTISAYRETGGITSALAETAEETWAALDPADSDEARAVLLALMQFGPNRTPMRHAVSPAELRSRFSASAGGIIDAFSDARLITVSADAVTFIHDAVLSAWPRMAGWIAEDADLIQWRQQVSDDAKAWAENGRRDDYLYSGARLGTSLENRAELGEHRQVLLSTGATEFLAAADQKRVAARRLRLGAVALVVVLALVSVIAALVAINQTADVANQRNEAEHAAVMSSIDGLVGTDPSLAARLLAVADQTYPNDGEARSGLLAASTSPLARSLQGHSGPVYDVVFSGDGNLLASASNDRTVRLFQRGSAVNGSTQAGFKEVATLAGFGDFVTSVTFDNSAKLLAAASGDGTVRVWNIADPARPKQTGILRPNAGVLYLTRFSPSGKHLVTSADDGTVRVYRVDGDRPPEQTAVLRGHTASVRTVAFNSTGSILASGGEDQTVRLWKDADSDTPTPVGVPLDGFPSITHALAFLPGDAVLAVTGDSANAQLWNVANPDQPRPNDEDLPGVAGGSWSMSANSTQPLLARAGTDGVVRVWNTVSPENPLPLWELQRSAAPGAVGMLSASFSPDGQELVVGRTDGTIDLWTLPPDMLIDRGSLISGVDLDAKRNRLVTVGEDARLNVWANTDGKWRKRSSIGIQSKANNRPRVAVTTDGSLVATANNNGELVELWDIVDVDHPRRVGELRVHTRFTNAIAFAPGTRQLATGADDRRIQRWDVTDPAAPRAVGEPLAGPEDLIRSVAYSVDGKQLAVGADDGNAYVYRLNQSDGAPLVVPMGEQVTAVVFASDGRFLVVAARDLAVWNVAGTEADQVSRVLDVHAVAIGRAGKHLLVGTETREITDFAIGSDGALGEGAVISPVLGGLRNVSRWVLPADAGPGPQYPTAGDGTGVVYLQTTDSGAAREWICATTGPLSPDERDRYLGRVDANDGC
ncbi:MAG: AAA family ATPase [Gordonia sp. (in: high G+C Gram-positive bacteria)]|uniref:nSTAND1 domain-containing NTPase n=1 Tax=Gordonia sp. (in: high G+C Gram-positive bacteria) TaxID=84139 RepID=UPI003C710978